MASFMAIACLVNTIAGNHDLRHAQFLTRGVSSVTHSYL
jgi:hypothetical protein